MSIVASFILLSIQASAPPQLGERTRSPEQMLRDMPLSDAEEEAIAAAASHPLGTAANPVRVGGPEGERAYIAKLLCADGRAPKVGQRSSAGVGAFGTIVDIYPLDCGSAAPGKVNLVMDMYHEEHRETQAPAGFTLAD